jgi:hypothetical protein
VNLVTAPHPRQVITVMFAGNAMCRLQPLHTPCILGTSRLGEIASISCCGDILPGAMTVGGLMGDGGAMFRVDARRDWGGAWLIVGRWGWRQ